MWIRKFLNYVKKVRESIRSLNTMTESFYTLLACCVKSLFERTRHHITIPTGHSIDSNMTLMTRWREVPSDSPDQRDPLWDILYDPFSIIYNDPPKPMCIMPSILYYIPDTDKDTNHLYMAGLCTQQPLRTWGTSYSTLVTFPMCIPSK